MGTHDQDHSWAVEVTDPVPLVVDGQRLPNLTGKGATQDPLNSGESLVQRVLCGELDTGKMPLSMCDQGSFLKIGICGVPIMAQQ